MSEYIILSPYSQKLRNGKNNPKNYPYWTEIVANLKYPIVQIGGAGEVKIQGVDSCVVNAPFNELKELTNKALTFISVDNFFPHFCALYSDITGVVVFSQSDPNIFGYDQNTNLLKDRKYLRNDQFGIWENIEFKASTFVRPMDVIAAVKRQININLSKRFNNEV